jgi:hypothetical protein
MVYFNDPLPCPNHAQQAVKMAIAMRQAVYSLREEWEAFSSVQELASQPAMPG